MLYYIYHIHMTTMCAFSSGWMLNGLYVFRMIIFCIWRCARNYQLQSLEPFAQSDEHICRAKKETETFILCVPEMQRKRDGNTESGRDFFGLCLLFSALGSTYICIHYMYTNIRFIQYNTHPYISIQCKVSLVPLEFL